MRPAGVGYLLGFGAGGGLAAWVYGAEPHLRGGFEGEGRDLSVLYVELPALVVGVPTVSVAVLLLVHSALGRRTAPAARGTVAAVATVAGLATVAALVWGGLTWLESTAPTVYRETPL